MITDEIMDRMNAMMPSGANLEIPPKIFKEMEGEMLAFEEGKSLTARFPVKERYQNPMGFMQGGMIATAIDNVMGPLSYLVAPPSVTTQLNTSYIRPVTPNDEYIEVYAEVVERTKTQIFISARVTNASGKLIALSQSTSLIVNKGG